MANQRLHLRVQLHLPARLRWLGPLGFFVEVAETLDVCRGGLLFYRAEPCTQGAPVWVTFPYQPKSTENPAELPARVVRVKSTSSGGHLVAIEFEATRAGAETAEANRRSSERVAVAVPIRVRAGSTPWPEETMTQDLSPGGVLFRSARQYAPGETVRVAIPYGTWALAGELTGRVTRVEPAAGSAEQRVAVALEPAATNR